MSLPVVAIGNARYTDMVISMGNIVGQPSGTAPSGAQTSYDPVTRQMTVPAATVGATTYYNAIITVAGLVSIGGVTGVDNYTGGQLNIPSVQVLGGSAYHNVAVTVSKIISAGGGMPANVRDVYDPATGKLTIAAIQLGNTVYTNAIVTVGTILSVGGAGP